MGSQQLTASGQIEQNLTAHQEIVSIITSSEKRSTTCLSYIYPQLVVMKEQEKQWDY